MYDYGLNFKKMSKLNFFEIAKSVWKYSLKNFFLKTKKTGAKEALAPEILNFLKLSARLRKAMPYTKSSII